MNISKILVALIAMPLVAMAADAPKSNHAQAAKPGAEVASSASTPQDIPKADAHKLVTARGQRAAAHNDCKQKARAAFPQGGLDFKQAVAACVKG